MAKKSGSGGNDMRIGRDPQRRIQRRKLRAGGWTKDKRERFLRHLAHTSNVAASARVVGMSVSGLYKLRDRDAAFRKAWAEALAEGYVQLEMEMLRRARFGTVETTKVNTKGEKKFHFYSDANAMRLLQSHWATVSVQNAIATAAGEIGAPQTTDEKLAALREMLAKAREGLQ
jgi:hypothetical protein